MHKIPGFLLILLICSACGGGPPRSLIPEDKLVPMLVDFHLTYYVQQNPDFREITSQYDSVDSFSYLFEKHGYTKAEFDTTLSWYLRNAEYYVDIYDEVIMKLTQINDSINSEESDYRQTPGP